MPGSVRVGSAHVTVAVDARRFESGINRAVASTHSTVQFGCWHTADARPLFTIRNSLADCNISVCGWRKRFAGGCRRLAERVPAMGTRSNQYLQDHRPHNGRN